MIYKYIFVFVLAFSLYSCQKKELTSLEVLENAIAYHDPNGNWNTFNGTLHVTMQSPNQSDRNSEIKINLPKKYFYVKATRDTITTVFELNKDSCTLSLNGKTTLTEEEISAHRLTCDRASLYKNYYTYLYGLPMKLKDPGTHLADTIIHKTFKGKDYLVLKATYDETVGSDIWYFYFNPETFAMEVYQFFRQDEKGHQKEDTGEYILISEEASINDIKMPKVRAWYYNKDDAYLGTDILN